MVNLNASNFFPALRAQGAGVIQQLRRIPFPSFEALSNLSGSQKIVAGLIVVGVGALLFAVVALVKKLWNRNDGTPALGQSQGALSGDGYPKLQGQMQFVLPPERQPGEAKCPGRLCNIRLLADLGPEALSVEEMKQVIQKDNYNSVEFFILTESLTWAIDERDRSSDRNQKIERLLQYLSYDLQIKDYQEDVFGPVGFEECQFNLLMGLASRKLYSSLAKSRVRDSLGFSPLAIMILRLENAYLSGADQALIQPYHNSIKGLIEAGADVNEEITLIRPENVENRKESLEQLGEIVDCGALAFEFESKWFFAERLLADKDSVVIKISDLATSAPVRAVLGLDAAGASSSNSGSSSQ